MLSSAAAGWALAVLAVAAGYASWGWPGVALALTVVVFWLLLQWSRVIRTLRLAGGAPVGQVPSAVMLQARLSAGMRLLDVLPLTRSLGQRVGEAPEVWRWADASGAAVELEFAAGRLQRWRLSRAGDGAAAGPAPVASPPAPSTPAP